MNLLWINSNIDAAAIQKVKVMTVFSLAVCRVALFQETASIGTEDEGNASCEEIPRQIRAAACGYSPQSSQSMSI